MTIHIANFSAPGVLAPIRPGTGILAVADIGQGSSLVLLVDLQKLNRGASLTNMAERAINHLKDTVFNPIGQSTTLAEWVEMDSEGHFDQIIPCWGESGDATAVHWRAVSSDNTAPRTLEAFLASRGHRAQHLWKHASTEIAWLTKSAPPVRHHLEGVQIGFGE